MQLIGPFEVAVFSGTMSAPRPRLIHPGVSSEVIRHCPAGHELVRRCYPLKRAQGTQHADHIEPFPTLFWLTCNAVIQQISQLEHAGAIEALQEALRTDDVFRARVHRDHRAYIEQRHRQLSPDDLRLAESFSWWRQFQNRGIGGIENWNSVKCLHLHYAHHLAGGSEIGRWIEAHARIALCHQPDTDKKEESETSTVS